MRRAPLKLGEMFDVTETPPARFDHRVCAAFLGHERDQLFMVRRATVGARQRARVPLVATAAAAKVKDALDAAPLRQCRPRAADRTISFRPAFRYRPRPVAIASLQ